MAQDLRRYTKIWNADLKTFIYQQMHFVSALKTTKTYIKT
jgi:hypothetical protein